MDGRRRAGSRARDVSDERAVRFLSISAGLEIARRRVVGFQAPARDPRQTRVRRYRRVRLVQVGVDGRIAGEAKYPSAVGEEINVLRTDDVHELEHWLASEGRGSLRGTLALRMISGRSCG